MKLALRPLGLLAAALAIATSANAASLRPSGKYAFTTTEQCEAKFTFTFGSYKTANNTTDNAVRVINSVANGSIGAGVGYITFTPTSATGGTFKMSLTDIDGGALRINTGGGNVSTKQQSLTGAYTFTATAMTLTPASSAAMSYTMAYGSLSSTGVPASVHLVRQSSSGETTNCVQAITAMK